MASGNSDNTVILSLSKPTALSSNSANSFNKPASSSQGEAAFTNSASDNCFIYCLLNQFSLSTLNTAPVLPTLEKSKSFTSSSKVYISFSVPGFQPKKATKFTSASG